MEPDDISFNRDASEPVHPQALGVINAFLEVVVAEQEHTRLNSRDNIAMPHGPHGDCIDPALE
jgi:hypothetical protein